MKKIFILILTVLIFSLVAVSCDEKKTESDFSRDVSEAPAPTSREILSKVIDVTGDEGIIVYDFGKKEDTSTTDELIDNSFLSDMYGTLETTVDPEKFESLSVFLPEAQEANEVHIAKPKSSSDIAEVKGYLEKRLSRLKEMFVGYLPEQAGIANKGKLTEYKGYVFLVVTSDKNDEIIKAIKDYIDK